jgi:WD40 repeat protein/mono/diheme cytochrome c family protein
MRHALVLALLAIAPAAGWSAAPPRSSGHADLARRAQAVLRKSCYRCHGEDGAVEGGMNYLLDRDKLVARRKIIPGAAEKSPLYRPLVKGSMPPAGQSPRPSRDEILLVRRWIDSGAPGARAPERTLVREPAVLEWILADLDKLERRSRRFTRYFSLASLHNAGHGPDELKTYRNALGKLLNSLSWHPRITLPRPIDPQGLVLRIDLRDYQLDANSWNRLLADYPYGILYDTAVSRAVLVATATRMPVVRADWFVATASRAPLYYELLQIPSNLADLERQLRVDVSTNIQQERVARAGFNGSGISKNNRILERHDAMNGAYWRSYDFEAVPQNLLERNILLPDRRNIFAYPLGPGLGENGFQHAAGEVIFNLPNGLQAYVLVNANNQRVDKGVTTIVSDPKRPDRAVEAGISCMNCHARGIIPKDDQLREHVTRNKKAFSRTDAELVEALYPPAKKMRGLMEEDAERFQKAVARTGNKTTAAEVVMAMTLRYESDVDLPALAAEVGMKPEALLPRLAASENLAKNLGALKLSGGVVSRQVVVQAFGDLVREIQLGTVLEPGRSGESLPDATGEADPLEAQSHPANAMAFSRDGKLAASASNDKSVRIYDIEAGRDLRRCVGHTASVWCVDFSPDGTKLLSGGKDGTVRLWDVETGRELLKLDAHLDLVSSVSFSPNGKRALSAGYDHEVQLWNLERGERVAGFSFAGAKYIHTLAFAPEGNLALVGGENVVYLIDANTGKVQRKLEGHTAWVTAAVFSSDGKKVASASDDGTVRLWETATGRQVQTFNGHSSYVKSVAISSDGKLLLSGGSDATVRLWNATTGKQLRLFRKHTEPLVASVFAPGGRQTLSGSRDAIVQPWNIGGVIVAPPPRINPRPAGPAKEPPILKPEAVIPVGGTVGSLILAPDRSALYYLNLTDSVLGRVDTKTLRRDRTLKLVAGSDVLAMSPDGKTLAALGRSAPDKGKWSHLQIIDPAKLTETANWKLPLRGYDLALRDGGLAFISGADEEWSEVSLVDLRKGAVAARWGGVWGRSYVQLSPDSRRLYASSQGVVPGTLDAFVLPARLADLPSNYRAAGYDKLALGGEFTITPDGRFMLCKTGTVLRLSAEKEDDMRLHVRLVPFLAAAIEEGKTAWLLDREGNLRQYSYPEFKLQSRRRLSISGYRIAVDGKAGRLYVAGFDPRSVAERPRAKAHGDIHVYAIKEWGGR